MLCCFESSGHVDFQEYSNKKAKRERRQKWSLKKRLLTLPKISYYFECFLLFVSNSNLSLNCIVVCCWKGNHFEFAVIHHQIYFFIWSFIIKICFLYEGRVNWRILSCWVISFWKINVKSLSITFLKLHFKASFALSYLHHRFPFLILPQFFLHK